MSDPLDKYRDPSHPAASFVAVLEARAKVKCAAGMLVVNARMDQAQELYAMERRLGELMELFRPPERPTEELRP